MPLQFLPLQQRQKQQPRSVVSEALTPQPTRKGFAEAGGTMPNRFVEEQKAKWAEEDKLRKMERDAKVNEAQEMGMRIRDAYEKEKAQGRQMSMQAAAGAQAEAPTAGALTKEKMPEAAMEVWKFISTLEPESQKFFIQQLKEKELGTGGFIETGGKRKEMPGSLGMYGHLVDQGLIDPATDTVIEKKPEEMKGRFEIVEKGGKVYKYDTTTGEEEELGSVDKPEDVVNEITKQIRKDAIEVVKVDPNISLEDATHDAAIDYGLSEEESVEIAKFTEMPEGAKKKSALGEWFENWFKNIGKAEVPSGYQRKGAGVGAKPAFNEANVTSLIDIISDDVTTAERAHLKGQGASDSDIEEAIKRKGSR